MKSRKAAKAVLIILFCCWLAFGAVGWIGVFTEWSTIEQRNDVRAVILLVMMFGVGLPIFVRWVKLS